MKSRVGYLLVSLASLLFPLSSLAQFAPVGSLDCNGLSKIQKPLRKFDVCADFRTKEGRGEDNGVYIGHDEPSVDYLSSAPHSGNNMQWEVRLPRERPLPATQSFENYLAFWFGMALCDPNSYPRGTCIPDSDKNDPNKAGSAFLEMQFYPPGFSPFISQISCDLTHWCASLHINSLEVMDNGQLNPNCAETTNFAFIQRNGIPTGPAGPTNATVASYTPNRQTLLMNQGDRLRVTLKDTPDGLMTRIEDLSTGQSGFMVSSAKNGYQTLNPNTCVGKTFNFHPEYATAKYGNFVPWAALQANITFDVEIGHFTPGVHGDNDADDGPCFPGPTVPGCINFNQGGDIDFDGTSYLVDWPDGTRNNATSLAVRGPLSVNHEGEYSRSYRQVQFETEVAASETTCMPDGSGCVVPPVGAVFYPYYSVFHGGEQCSLMFGNLSGPGFENFGADAQYGTPNLPWFFATLSSGPVRNPCIPDD